VIDDCCPHFRVSSSQGDVLLNNNERHITTSTATDYGLDGPGSNPGGDEIFRPSKPALGSTQPPVQWVPGLSRGVEVAGAWG